MIPVTNLWNIWALLSLALYGGMFIYALMHIREKTVLSFAILWFLIAISMYSNILVPVVGIVGERFVFVGSVGFAIALVYVIFILFKTDPKNLTIEFDSRAKILVIIFLILIPYTALTISRNREWRNLFDLFRSDIPYLENSAKANNQFAGYLMTTIYQDENFTQYGNVNQFKVEKIKEHFHRSIKLYPDNYQTLNDLGTVYLFFDKKPDSAIYFFKKAIAINPDVTPAWVNMGKAYREQGNYKEAITCYETILKNHPNEVRAIYALANVYNDMGDFNRAVQMNEDVIRQMPDEDIPYMNIGNYYMQRGDTTMAVKNWEQAVAKRPSYEGCMQLSYLYKMHGDMEKAQYFYQMALDAYEKNQAETTTGRTMIPATLGYSLQQTAAEFPREGITFIRPDKSGLFVSYPELLDHSLRLLKGFQRLGWKQGECVILSLDSNAEIIPVLWACFLGGIVPALLQPPVSFTHHNPAAEKAERVFHQMNGPHVILSHNHLEGWLQSGLPKDHFTDLQDISVGEADPILPVVSPEDLALIQFSSGSTGEPKGVMLTHRNILVNVGDIIKGINLKQEDNSVSWMPLFHDMGLIGFHITPLTIGIRQHFIEPADFIKNPFLWLDTLSEKKARITGCPNFGQMIVNRSLGRKQKHDWDLSLLRVIFNGAEPISIATMDEFLSGLKPFRLSPEAMFPAYGMAEATLAVTFPPLHEGAHVLTFKRTELLRDNRAILTDENGPEGIPLVNLGRSLDCCEIRVVDHESAEVGENMTGNVQVRGENITHGYFNNPEATSHAIIDGWLETGDLGFLHDGNLFIIGRSKDIIFINGINFYSHDLENIALQTEGTTYQKIVVAGYFDEKAGRDKVIIFLVAADNESTINLFRALKTHFLNVAGISIDTFIPIKSSDIPRTSSGKIQRYKLVNRFLQNDFSHSVKQI